MVLTGIALLGLPGCYGTWTSGEETGGQPGEVGAAGGQKSLVEGASEIGGAGGSVGAGATGATGSRPTGGTGGTGGVGGLGGSGGALMRKCAPLVWLEPGYSYVCKSNGAIGLTWTQGSGSGLIQSQCQDACPNGCISNLPSVSMPESGQELLHVACKASY